MNHDERSDQPGDVPEGDSALERQFQQDRAERGELDDDDLTRDYSHGAGEAKGRFVAGRYKLLEEIGEGGMGSVWVAEQTTPVKRYVALKLIKPGMDSKAVLARFEAERQALAMMNHDNIAKILDGGVTEAGRPFFVMELVKGLPLTQYCDEKRMTVRDRLELFVQICAAVQHAHQKGIIHRDLKPRNILVTEHDGKPKPKVIDFGLAKALAGVGALTDRSLYTAFGTVVGTPQYMAPEQVGINALDVDTRTDIYSLGVVLYELLTGTTPLDAERFKQAAWDETKRVIREEEPPRPSNRLQSSGSLPSLAATRHTEPVSLTKQVRGDLDWIVMKALEKDRNRRYETANGFAMDVQRHLSEEPVLAGPPSFGYKVGKFVRRNKKAVVAGVGFAALVLLGIIGLVVGIVSIDAERTRTANALADLVEQEQKTQAALNNAREELATREAVQSFFLDKVFAAGRPEGHEGGLGHSVTLRKAVDNAEPTIAESFKERPLVEAAIRQTLGLTYWYLSEPDLAIRQHEQALSKRQQHLGAEHPDTLQSMNNLAAAYHDVGKLDLALPLFEKTLAL